MRVIWETTVLDRLADYYARLSVDGQRVIAATVEAVNARLAADPLAVGEGRGENYRVLIRSPLTVYYEIVGQEVRVTGFHIIERRAG